MLLAMVTRTMVVIVGDGSCGDMGEGCRCCKVVALKFEWLRMSGVKLIVATPR